MNDTIKAPLILTLICGTVCGLLALGNHLTVDKIAASEQEALQSALTEAFGDAEYTAVQQQYDGINQVILDNQNRMIFDMTATGYEKNGQHLLVGIDSCGAVCGVSVVSIADSPTQSKKVQEDSFLSQFMGQTDSHASFDAVTGATKSSEGIHSAVKLALDTYQNLSDGKDG